MKSTIFSAVLVFGLANICHADAVVIVQSDGKTVPVVTVTGATDVKVKASGSVQVQIADPPAPPAKPVQVAPPKPPVLVPPPPLGAAPPFMPRLGSEAAKRQALRELFAKKTTSSK